MPVSDLFTGTNVYTSCGNLAGILSRYPKTEYEDFPLPDSSPLFCLPLGVCVEHWDNNGQFPLPTFSTFILTNSYGAKVRLHIYHICSGDNLTLDVWIGCDIL